jgi:hypothetical protein
MLIVKRLTFGVAFALLVCSVAGAADNRGYTNQKGSLLMFPKIVVDTAGGVDTFVDITNAGDSDVWVTCYWVDGAPGWKHPDFHFKLTVRHPAYFRASDGLPGPMGAGVQQFPADPGAGELKCWATTDLGVQVKHNFLKGEAVINDTANGSAWEYAAWAFQCRRAVTTGKRCGDADGTINLNGTDYDYCPKTLELDFFSSNDKLGQSTPLGGALDTDVAFVPCDQDLTQAGEPVTTKEKYEIWDENEIKRTGLTRCMTCFDEVKLSAIGTTFRRSVLHTEKGLARIDGVADDTKCCPKELDPNGNPVPEKCSQKTALVGVQVKEITRKGPRVDRAGTAIHGAGTEAGKVTYEPGDASEEGR